MFMMFTTFTEGPQVIDLQRLRPVNIGTSSFTATLTTFTGAVNIFTNLVPTFTETTPTFTSTRTPQVPAAQHDEEQAFGSGERSEHRERPAPTCEVLAGGSR